MLGAAAGVLLAVRRNVRVGVCAAVVVSGVVGAVIAREGHDVVCVRIDVAWDCGGVAQAYLSRFVDEEHIRSIVPRVWVVVGLAIGVHSARP